MAFGSGAQQKTAPWLGVFPLDKAGLCTEASKAYLKCLKAESDAHHRCQELSRAYIECRMDKSLMERDDPDRLGLSKGANSAAAAAAARDTHADKEKAGFVSGQHIKSRYLFGYGRADKSGDAAAAAAAAAAAERGGAKR